MRNDCKSRASASSRWCSTTRSTRLPRGSRVDRVVGHHLDEAEARDLQSFRIEGAGESREQGIGNSLCFVPLHNSNDFTRCVTEPSANLLRVGGLSIPYSVISI